MAWPQLAMRSSDMLPTRRAVATEVALSDAPTPRFGLFSANSASPFSMGCLTGFEMADAAWQGASGTYAGHGHGRFITVTLAGSTGTLMTFTAKSR